MKKPITFLLGSLFSLAAFGQNALHFDGTNDKIDVGNPANLQISGSNVTVEAWINPDSWAAQVWQGNIVNQENNSTNDGFMLRVGANGTLNFGIGTANTSWYEINSASGAIALNTWTHVAGTYDGTYLRIYKNGTILDSSLVNAGPMVAGNIALTIGARRTDRFYNGEIDEVRIWTVTRTASEIAQDMNKEFCGQNNGLAFYLKMNEGVAGGSNAGVTTAPDFSGNNNDGTLSGFNLSGSSSNWVGGVSMTLPAGDSVAVSDSLCDGYRYFIGPHTIKVPGNHKVHLVNQDGCDSLVDLTLHPKYTDASTSYQGQSFIANNTNPGVTYQWVNCSTWGILVGETSAQYWPSNNQEYAVFVTENNCMDTSECMSLLYASTKEYVLGGLKIYPNPANEYLNIEIEELNNPKEFTLLGMNGQIVSQQPIVPSEELRIPLKDLSKGMYIVNIKTDDGIRVLKFTKD